MRTSTPYLYLFALLSFVCFLLAPTAGQEPSISPSAIPSPAAASVSPAVSPASSPAASPSPALPSTSPVVNATASPSPIKSDNDTIVSAPVPDDDDDDHWTDHVSNRMILGLVVAFAVPAIVIGALVAAWVTYKTVQRRRFVETPRATSVPRTDGQEAEMEQYPNPDAVFSIDDEEEDNHL